jgi:hypothetical protein
MLKKVILPNNSIEYIKNELFLGGNLSQQLINLDFGNGKTETYLPLVNGKINEINHIDYSESIEFLYGINVARDFKLILRNIILKFLNNDPTKYVIFETPWNEDDLTASKQLQLQYFTINRFVYDYLKGDDNQENIYKYLLDAQVYPTVISLLDIQNNNIMIKPKSSLDNGIVLELINQTVGLIIGAYDGEGYLFWKKHGCN